MSTLRKKIEQEILNPALSKMAGINIGTIVDWNPDTKEAWISFAANTESGEKILKNVPMLRQEGQHESGPYIGDTVVLGFINNDYSKPIIIGRIESNYTLGRKRTREQHKRKGGNVSDVYTRRSSEDWSARSFN